MKIYKNEFNTPPMQIEENRKNIELLASYIKEAYRSNVSLISTDVSVAISDTNADVTTIDGWLLDPNGLLFKITNGDGTNLLIEFYANIKGDQGANGQDGQDGANGTNGQDGKSFIMVSGVYLAIGYTATIPYGSFNITPQVNDLVVDDQGIVGIVTSVDGSNADVYGEFSIKGAQGQNGADGQTYGLLAFTNVNVESANFVSSAVYTDYPYECVVLQTNQVINKIVSGGMVTYDVDEADSGNFASVCDINTTTGEITIYSKIIPSDFTIPSIWLIAE